MRFCASYLQGFTFIFENFMLNFAVKYLESVTFGVKSSFCES